MKWPSTGKARQLVYGIAILGAILTFGLFSLAAKAALAETFVQSFSADSTLRPAYIVALSKNKSNSVELASLAKTGSIYGVVIDPSQTPLTIQHQGQQVFVANNGSYQVLASTENGLIKAGDYISLSVINGIGAKATSHEPYIIGQSLAAFDGKTNVITSTGSSAIGLVTVSVNPGRNPLLKDDVAIPSSLRKLGESIAGKSVSAIRIYSSLGIFVVTAIVASSLLWVGVRSGMLAIGRNPLSRRSVIRSILQVVIVSILIFIAGLLGVYLLLKL